jgi:hypothetical protein
MAQGCLAALFGIGVQPRSNRAVAQNRDNDGSGMGEGEIHSGPGGYEGMGYSGGYAADYLAEDDENWDEGEEA